MLGSSEGQGVRPHGPGWILRGLLGLPEGLALWSGDGPTRGWSAMTGPLGSLGSFTVHSTPLPLAVCHSLL